MIAAVADTHAVIWFLFKNPKLSNAARNAMESAFRRRLQIGISSISLVEMVYLTEKGRIPATALARLINALRDAKYPFQEIPVDRRVAACAQQVSREEVPDMPDRIIAATGILMSAPVISRDGRIRSTAIETIW